MTTARTDHWIETQMDSQRTVVVVALECGHTARYGSGEIFKPGDKGYVENRQTLWCPRHQSWSLMANTWPKREKSERTKRREQRAQSD